MSTFTEHLHDRGLEGLVALLDLRRDLAAPPPATLRALAARAAGRASLDRALARVDVGVLAVCDAVLVLAPPVRLTDVAAALGVDVTRCQAWLATAAGYALVHPDEDRPRPAPGLVDLLGPYPAGLGPPLASRWRAVSRRR